MAEIAHGTWVLIADGEKALFLENLTDAEDPFLEVRRVADHHNPPTREQGAHKPGRMPDGPSAQRSALDDTDWHRLEKERFAEELAEILYDRAHKGRFERLIIAAAPMVLGDLRDKLHKEVRDRVVAEIDKNLTNHPIGEIEKIVAES